MHVWNVLHAARWKCRTQKVVIWAPLHNFVGYIFATKARIDNQKKRLVKQKCLHNMVNFAPLAPEICWRVWGTPANFNGFRVLATLLHGTLVVGVNQTLWRWTEGATYIGRAAITLGIDPHSSVRFSSLYFCCLHWLLLRLVYLP